MCDVHKIEMTAMERRRKESGNDLNCFTFFSNAVFVVIFAFLHCPISFADTLLGCFFFLVPIGIRNENDEERNVD